MTDVEALLTKHGVEYRLRGKEATAHCPECGGDGTKHGCWSVNVETGTFTCNRKNHCGWSGGFRELQRYFGEQPIGRPKLTVNVTKKPKTYKTPDPAKLNQAGSALYGWFEGRGLTRETVDAFGIQEHKGAIAFPVHGTDGGLVNVKYRAMDAKKFWNEEGTLRLPFGLQTVPNDSDVLLITEGEIDALSAFQYGVKAVISLPNGTADQEWIEALWGWLERFKTIWLSTDMDEAGQGARRLLVERLGAWRCRGVELPHKDLNECLMKGVPQETILELFDHAEEYKPDKLRNASEFGQAVKDAFKNKAGLIGVPTGLPDLDALIKGWRGGELSIWTGQNGAGKSTVLGQVAVNLVDRGERVCIASLELSPQRYIRWLVCQLLDQADPPEASIDAAIETLSAGAWFVDHVGSIKTPILLDTFEYAARRYGVRHFIVDSLVKLGISGDDYNGQREAVSDLCDFADRFDSHVHLVAHPRKGDSDNDKPDKTAVKGAGEITDLADNVLSVYRNKKPKPGAVGTILSLLKHREHGLEGDVALSVNPDTKRVQCAALSVEIGGGYGRGRKAVWSDAEIGD